MSRACKYHRWRILELARDEKESLANIKDLVTQLYTQMHLSEWHASREKELVDSIDAIKHELAPYEQVRYESSIDRTEMY